MEESAKRRLQLSFTLKQIQSPEIFLSDLNPVRLTAGWRQPELNRNFNSGGLIVGGRQWEKGHRHADEFRDRV
jgi:hypothetical protein